MKHLIIDKKDYGPCSEYKQDRKGLFPGWVFLMDGTCIEIKVPVYLIKHFDSASDLEIITYNSNK